MRRTREFLEPQIRRNEILRFLESGPEDISMSRTGQAWGIPLPNDPGSVVYVWVDALINYISAVGFGWDEGLCEKWWPGRPACRRKGHHPFSLCDLAGDADERWPPASPTGVWPRLGPLEGSEDEQVARGPWSTRSKQPTDWDQIRSDCI